MSHKAGALIGITQHALSNLETGQTKLSLELAVVIAETFEVGVEALVVKR